MDPCKNGCLQRSVQCSPINACVLHGHVQTVSSPSLDMGLGGAPCAVRKVRNFGPIFPDGQRDRGHHCGPIHRTAPDSYSVQKHGNEMKQTMFHTENARMLSIFYLSLLLVLPVWTCASPVVGGLQGGHGKANLLLGAVRTLCRSPPLRPSVSFLLCVSFPSHSLRCFG